MLGQKAVAAQVIRDRKQTSEAIAVAERREGKYLSCFSPWSLSSSLHVILFNGTHVLCGRNLSEKHRDPGISEQDHITDLYKEAYIWDKRKYLEV